MARITNSAVARGKRSEPVPSELHLTKILVPTDFSDHSEQAFNFALNLAQEFGSEIVLLNVLEPLPRIRSARLARQTRNSQDELTVAEQELRKMAARSDLRSSISSTVRAGEAPNEITAAAKDLNADLIVIATHGHTSWRRFCLGSTTDSVVRHASCPVLVVREKEHEFI